MREPGLPEASLSSPKHGVRLLADHRDDLMRRLAPDLMAIPGWSGVAVTQVRMHPPAMAYMARKQADGMSYREPLRCLKRLIARTVFTTMLRAEKAAVGAVVRVEFDAPPVAQAV